MDFDLLHVGILRSTGERKVSPQTTKFTRFKKNVFYWQLPPPRPFASVLRPSVSDTLEYYSVGGFESHGNLILRVRRRHLNCYSIYFAFSKRLPRETRRPAEIDEEQSRFNAAGPSVYLSAYIHIHTI